MKVYLDSCIVIYLIEDPSSRHESVDRAMREHSSASFWVSDLVRMECRTGPLRRGDTETLAEFDAFFDHVAALPITRIVFDLATELRARHNLRTPDALHLATALVHNCDEFWTNDARLSTVSDQIAFRGVP